MFGVKRPSVAMITISAVAKGFILLPLIKLEQTRQGVISERQSYITCRTQGVEANACARSHFVGADPRSHLIKTVRNKPGAYAVAPYT